MKLIIYTIIIIITIKINNCSAQTDSLKQTTFGGYLIFPFENPYINVNNLNMRLNSLGYPNCDYPHFVFGFGISLHIRNRIILFSYNNGTERTDHNLGSTEVGYRATSFSYGIDLIKYPHFTLEPFLGIKANSLIYTYRENLTGSFNNYFSGNYKEKEITNSMTNLDIGVSFSYQYTIQIGFKYGLLFPIGKEGWKIQNNKVSLSDIPGIQRSSYLSLFIGLGGIQSVESRHGKKKNKLIKT